MAVATWGSIDTLAGGAVAPGGAADSIVTTQAGVSIGPPLPIGSLRRFSDLTGKYGAGSFIYLPGVASLTVGDVVTYNQSAGVSYTDATVARWAGVANSGGVAAVAMTANTSATTFSWYQLQGAAVINTSGTVAASDRAFFAATGAVQSTAVGGKQLLGATAFSANGVPATNQAVYTIDFPHIQSQIT